MRLSALNPVSMLFGPIFQKEMRTAGRKRGTYVIRALYAAGLLGLVCLAFAGIRSSTAMMGGVQRVQQLQQLAPQMALYLVWFQFIGLMLAAPILTAPSVCDEKRARTLSALMTTPLNAAQIVFGKLTSRLVLLAILALLVAPLLLAIRVFGGLDGRVVVATTAISLSTAFLGAALGLMYSTWHKRAANAAVFGLLTLLLLQAAPSAIEAVVYYIANTRDAVATGKRPEYQYHQDVLATCAPATMGLISARAVMGGSPPEMELTWLPHRQESIGTSTRPVPLTVPTWAVNTGYNILLGLLVTCYATVALRRIMLQEATTEGGAGAAFSRRERKKLARAAAQAPLADPAEGTDEQAPEALVEAKTDPAPEVIEESSRVREVSDRPVLWREVRQPLFGSRLRLIIVSVLAAVGLAFTYYWAGTSEGPFTFRVAFENEGLHGALAVIGAIAVMLQPVFMTAGAIANEREARTWEVLLTTPLPARSIMLGKLVGTLRTQWFIPAIVLAHFVLSAALGYVSPLLPLHLLLIYLGPPLLFSSTGLLFSLLFKRGVTAAVSNLLAALALWIGSWVGIGLIGWFLEFEDDETLSLASNGAYCMNPVLLTVSATESAVRMGRFGWSFHHNYEIHGINSHTVGSGVFTLITFGAFAFYAVVALGALSWAVALFPRFSGRAWAADHTPEEGFAAASRIISAALFVAFVGLVGLALARVPGLIVGIAGSLLLAGGTIIRSRHRAKPATPGSPPSASG